MANRNSLSQAQFPLIEAALQPGETLRWVGSEPAAHYRAVRIGRLAMYTLELVLAGGVASWLILQQADFLQAIAGQVLLATMLLLACAGGALLAREAFFPAKTGPDAYAITDRRALVVTPGRSPWLRSFPAHAVATMQVRRYPDGTGDILFESGYRWGRDPAGRSTWHWQPVGFFRVAGIDQVYLLLEQLAAPDRVLVKRGW